MTSVMFGLVRSAVRLLLALAAGLLVAAPPAAARGPHGSVLAWGCGSPYDYGQCAVPAAATSGVVAIAAGSQHSLALKRDGSVVAWGCGDGYDFGQCAVPAAARSGVVAIAAGFAQSLALKQDGSVVAWGCSGDDLGQCTVPPAAASGVKAIAAGFAHSLALKLDGSVVVWGCVGGFSLGQCTVPPAAGSGVVAIAASLYDSLAVKQDGSVVAWGCDEGAPGIDFGECTVPPAANGVTALAAGELHSLALKRDGSIVAWGCGDGADDGQCTVPAAAGGGVTAIAAGIYHSLALRQDGGVVAWGCRGGDFGECSVPAAAGSGVGAISAGRFHSLALFLDQTVAVTVHAPAAAAYGRSFTVAASSSAGLPVAFGSGGACSNAGATFTITSGTGTCLVRYDQPGDAAHGAAPQVVEWVTAQKASQSIAFAAIPRKTYGDPDFRVVARASSGLTVTFAAAGRCTVRGSRVHLTGVGSCTVTASQPGDANYEAAPDVARRFTIARAPCTVPDVVGKRLPAARLAIARRHCRTGKVRSVSSDGRKGVVVAQSPRPGRVLPAGSRIDLVVSRGR